MSLGTTQVGRGKESLDAGMQPFAAEVPAVPSLFTFYGRLQVSALNGHSMAKAKTRIQPIRSTIVMQKNNEPA